MNLNRDFSGAYARARLVEIKRELIDLMAREIAARRDAMNLRTRIADYEKYAREAVSKGEDELALEIAEKISNLESRLELQEKTNITFSAHVDDLKMAMNRLERRVDGRDERLQYMLDYLDAAAELEEGSKDRSLAQKMRAAGIGPHANTGRDVLERIRSTPGTESELDD